MQRGLISSRGLVEKTIQEKGVLVNGKLIRKPGKKFPLEVKIELPEIEDEWISPNSIKLLKAKEKFKLDFKDKIVLEIGSESGSFSEIALHFEANKVYCVNDETNQIHAKLKSNAKLINLEKTFVRELNSTNIVDKIDFCLIDVSSISLVEILPFIHPFLKEKAEVLLILKPQFEVDKKSLNKDGLVKGKAIYPKVIEKIISEAKINNLLYKKHMESPILGNNSNLEFVMYFEKIG